MGRDLGMSRRSVTIHLSVPQARYLLLVMCFFRKVASGNRGQMAKRISEELGSKLSEETGESIDLETYSDEQTARSGGSI